jgi:hypothetical protein
LSESITNAVGCNRNATGYTQFENQALLSANFQVLRVSTLSKPKRKKQKPIKGKLVTSDNFDSPSLALAILFEPPATRTERTVFEPRPA